jgi:3-hydroxybutyryl-CoA dehydrogenase
VALAFAACGGGAPAGGLVKKIENIAIVGAGLMGHGIAEVLLQHPDYAVTLFDTVPAMLEAAPEKIRAIVKAVGGRHADLVRLRLTGSLPEAVRDADFVIEAIPEKLELKQNLFSEIENLAPRECIFASNTSVIPITAIGEKLRNKSRMIGTHWWNPPYLIPLVEVVQTVHTSPDVVKACMDLFTKIGKTPVHVKKDVPGFVANRLQHALWREAIHIVEAGICDAETVDLCIKNSFGLRLSVLAPLENADLVGMGLTEDIHRVILPDLSTAKQPSPLLRKMIEENRTGWATNAGFYDWTEDSKAALRARLIERLRLLLDNSRK